ncbi:MAG TPA: GNAT family N-acetyltransferase [Galbitalea sp.]
MIIREVDWYDPAGEALRLAQREELSERYGRSDSEPGPAPTAADVALFLVAFDGEEAIGCGGLRPLDQTHGEIKRMFVRLSYRGKGVSTAILRGLEAAARDRGWERLVLETGDRQPDAMRFYEREGYSPIPRFGYYVDSELSRCYERVLG